MQVALAMIKAGRTVNVGDHIPFVICVEPIGTVVVATPSGGAAPSLLTPPGPAAAAAASAVEAVTGASAPTPEVVAAPPTSSPAGPGPGDTPGSAAVPVTTPDKHAGSGGASSGPVSFASRAYHPEEVRKSGGRLHLDVEWYLSNQILPPVARKCLRCPPFRLVSHPTLIRFSQAFASPSRAHRKHALPSASVSTPPALQESEGAELAVSLDAMKDLSRAIRCSTKIVSEIVNQLWLRVQVATLYRGWLAHSQSLQLLRLRTSLVLVKRFCSASFAPIQAAEVCCYLCPLAGTLHSSSSLAAGAWRLQLMLFF